MKSLTDALNAKQQALKPRGKFSFKSRKTAVTNTTSDTKPSTHTETQEPQQQKTETKAPENSMTVRGITSKRWTLQHQEPPERSLSSVDVLIDQCHDDVIDLTTTSIQIAALHLTQLHRCVILCAPVQGSVLIEGCRECILVLACHQFRMHHSVHVDVYLHISSHPIIEDCNHVRFGVYAVRGMDERLTKAGLNKDENQYDRVDDFNWLKTQPSPHWQLLATNVLDWTPLQCEDEQQCLNEMRSRLPSIVPENP